MPAGDGTGPMGMGPMTGRRAGYCAGYSRPGFANFGGMGIGRGRGRGFRRMAAPRPFWGGYGYPPTVDYNQDYDEKRELQNQEEYLEEELKNVKDRLKRLEEDK